MSKSRTSTLCSKGSKVMKQEIPVWESFLGFQQVEKHELSTADVHLICSDGVVPAHAFVLQAVSPFFDKMFSTQGDYYLGIRPVIICDYKTDEIKRMIQFIYSGSIRVQSEKEASAFKAFLTTFDIAMDNSTVENLSGTREKFKTEPAALSYSGPQAEKVKKMHVQAFVPPSQDKNESYGKSNLKTGQSGNQSIVILPRKPVIPNSNKRDDADNDHISSTDTSEDEMDEAIFKDTEWFLNEAKRCQKCRKQCKTAAAASMCLTSHNRLRCYFCFKVVRNTEKLFNHFAKRHKKAGRENCLMCPFCEQAVPFKSVSCHVISLHLADPRSREQQTNSFNNGRSQGHQRPGRPVVAGPASKKSRQDDVSEKADTADKETLQSKGDAAEDKRECKLQNLEIILRNRSITGKIRVITVKKERPCAPARTLNQTE